MPNIIQLIETGQVIEAKKLMETKLYGAAAELLDQKYRKVIAEVYCNEGEKELTEKKARPSKKNKFANPVPFSPLHQMVKVGNKYGFKHKGTGSDRTGRYHEFEHPTGHKLTIHQGKSGPYFHHAKVKNGKWAHVGNGDSHVHLNSHLKKVFPAHSHKSRRKTRTEELQKKFGVKLTEKVQSLSEAAITRSGSPQSSHWTAGRRHEVGTGSNTPADLRFAKINNMKHTEHPFHSNVISHGYEHTKTQGDANMSRHHYTHQESGHGVVLTSHGDLHTWGANKKEAHQDINHYLTKVHEAIDPKSPSADFHVADRDGEGTYSHDGVEYAK